jgi:RNA polymerase sigma factor (TIGR02999 family)
MSEVTRILQAAQRGEPQAAEQLLPLVYDELRRLAARKLAHERPGQTLQATALVHEAYLRLVGNEPSPTLSSEAGSHAPDWNSRSHFFAAAAEAMRRILVESARRRASLKRGGQWQQQPLEDVAVESGFDHDKLLVLDEALTRLEAIDSVKGRLVKLRYFAGLKQDQAAEMLGISVATAERHWSYARAWLQREMAVE